MEARSFAKAPKSDQSALPLEQTGLLSTANLTLRVKESCWQVGRCHYPTSHGAMVSCTGSDITIPPSGCGLSVRSAGAVRSPLRKCLFISSAAEAVT